MIALMILATYVVGWTGSSALCMKMLGTRERCHSSYHWTQARLCKRYDGGNCWHSDGQINVQDVTQGTLMSLIWPILIVPAIAYRLAVYEKPVKNEVTMAQLNKMGQQVELMKRQARDADIARLEKECEIA
jgi:hypothetical protein